MKTLLLVFCLLTGVRAFAVGMVTAPQGSGTATGTNTGDVTLGAVGSTPSANGASLSGQVLTLQPEDATHPGVVTNSAQTISGVKTFSSAVTSSVASGSNAVNLLDGSRINLSTGDTSAYWYRSAANIIRTPGSLTIDTNLVVSGNETVSGTSDVTGIVTGHNQVRSYNATIFGYNSFNYGQCAGSATGAALTCSSIGGDATVPWNFVGAGGAGVQINSTTAITASYTFSGTIDFGSIAAGACADSSQVAANFAVNDPVACSWPAALEANLSGTCFVPSAGHLTFRVCNLQLVSAIDPASGTFAARAIR